jgi:hypothetical protein
MAVVGGAFRKDWSANMGAIGVPLPAAYTPGVGSELPEREPEVLSLGGSAKTLKTASATTLSSGPSRAH